MTYGIRSFPFYVFMFIKIEIIMKTTWNDLNIKESETGVKGSPTYVSKVFKNEVGRKCKLLNFEDENCIQTVIKEILEQ